LLTKKFIIYKLNNLKSVYYVQLRVLFVQSRLDDDCLNILSDFDSVVVLSH